MISKGKDQSRGPMIGAELSAFLRMLKDFKHASSNSKGISLAKRLVSGLALCKKNLYESAIKTSMTKKTSNPSNIYMWR
jgi:hypothetical protein